MSKNGQTITIDNISSLTTVAADEVLGTIFVEKTRSHGDHKIKRESLPVGAVELTKNGHPFYLLTLLDSGELQNITLPSEIKDKDLPFYCWIPLQVEKPVTMLYGLGGSLTEKIKLGIFFLFAFAALVVLFLIAITALGGNTGGMI